MWVFSGDVRLFFCSSRRRHTRCALVTGVQTCALPISSTLASPTATTAQAAAGSIRAANFQPCWQILSVVALMGSRVWSARPKIRSEEHTSELQSLMRISYAVFCLKKKKRHSLQHKQHANIANELNMHTYHPPNAQPHSVNKPRKVKRHQT